MYVPEHGFGGQPNSSVVAFLSLQYSLYIFIRHLCAKYMFCRLCEHMMKNNDIYIFANLSAILKL